tara:strand:+ start:826 stop:1299 length:474 start_codon:yes stop_codon:yes gene_type:complete
MKVLYTKDHFQKAKEVTWDDVIKKIDNENELKTLRTLIGSTARMTGSDSDAPSIICHNQNLPLTIFNAFQEVSQSFKVQSCHLYISFSSHAPTFGRHKDQVDVLILQAIGSVSYEFDDGSIYRVDPGDSIQIPKLVHHSPKVHSPRVTLSFSILDYE